jgi:hypothetical protein
MINNTTAEVLNRVMSLTEFKVMRTLDEPLQLRGGRIPFDIRADQDHIWFNVLAVSQQEAEHQVDVWLKGQEDYE